MLQKSYEANLSWNFQLGEALWSACRIVLKFYSAAEHVGGGTATTGEMGRWTRVVRLKHIDVEERKFAAWKAASRS